MRTTWPPRSAIAPLLLLGPLAPAPPVRLQVAQAQPTTVVAVRHGERGNDHPTDPTLTAEGRARAEALRDALRHAPVKAVYVTQYRRTRETAAPIAKARRIPVHEVATDARTAEEWATELARNLLSRHAGETVLVIGHQSTTVAIVAALTGKSVDAIPAEEFDRLYVASSTAARTGGVIEATYGRPTP